MYNLDIHQLILTVVGKHYYRTFGYRLCKVSCLAVLNVHTLHKNTQYINVSFLGETVGWYEDTGWMTLKVSCQGCFFSFCQEIPAVTFTALHVCPLIFTVLCCA